MPFGITFIHTATRGIVETFGRYTRIMTPGLNFYIPFVQRIVKLVPVYQCQDTFKFSVKTKDDVFTSLNIAVQYKIDENNVPKSYYSLSKPIDQINSYIEDTVRSVCPKMELNQLFESKDDICNSVNQELASKMGDHGYTIIRTLVTDINPDPKIREAMNEINAQKRLKEATRERAEGKKIEIVQEAEADKERKKLQGEGIALQRLAILSGYEEGITSICNKLNISPDTGISMTLATQYFDMLERIGTSDNVKTTFIPHTPGGLIDIVGQIRNGVLQGAESMPNKRPINKNINTK